MSVFPGLFFCFAATVLLVFVSVSSPTWESISFLDVGSGPSVRHFGVFGYTGSEVGIGYEFPGLNSEPEILDDFTKGLILHPIAAGLSGIALLFGLCGVRSSSSGRGSSAMLALFSALADLTTLAAFAIDIAIFTIVRNRYRDAGIEAQWGNAIWITLAAVVANLLGFCTGVCGICTGNGRRQPRSSRQIETADISAGVPKSRIQRWFASRGATGNAV
ncbi:hypothetical protein Moror_6618 [Moniliophthora roreri MCA 2997]|uniref:Pali-domain-containing protein n=2 Tax=Moniliophthora roreri TaxID=221103 RepID=V2XST9_MONRO|nr:hypothetical protein Moror_6618 [Moniliophthora roreri MCA 2997]